MLKVPFISLVNLNLGREAVRELVQSSADPTEAQRALGAILPGGSERERMLGDYDELHAVMAGRVPAIASPATWSPNSARERRTATAKHKTERSMKETLIIAIILGAFALLASLRAARLDAANAAKPRRQRPHGRQRVCRKGSGAGAVAPHDSPYGAVGMAVLAIGITLTTWLLLRAGSRRRPSPRCGSGFSSRAPLPSSRSSNAANAENNTRNPEPMTESLVIAAILAICAVILWLRPQSISTLSGNPEENPEINWRAVRRIGAGGLLLLAVVIGGGSWLLLRAGVEPQTITVLGILLLFIGAIGLTAAVELCKKRKS